MVVFADRTAAESIDPAERRERLYDLPPSAKLVYAALEAGPGVDQDTLATRSRLSKRTVRHALASLTDAAVVEQRVSPRDARRRVYRPLPVEDDGGIAPDPGSPAVEAAETDAERSEASDTERGRTDSTGTVSTGTESAEEAIPAD